MPFINLDAITVIKLSAIAFIHAILASYDPYLVKLEQ
jgi:hypothetical protein